MSCPYHLRMLTRDLHFDLPTELIATEPAEPRDSARLMVINREAGSIDHRHVRDLPGFVRPDGPLRPGDLLVFNQTRVLQAGIAGTRAATGGKVTGLFLGHDVTAAGETSWRVLLESGGKLQPGESITLLDGVSLRLIESIGRGEWRTILTGDDDTHALLDRIGTTPLPPYIRKQRKLAGCDEVRPADASRYNTVFAKDPGSVAAPTAALHFTESLLDALQQAGLDRTTVTLNIGLGTFAPVRTAHLEDHPIHAERMHVSRDAVEAIRRTRAAGGRIIPIGTTSVRALESLPSDLSTVGASGYATTTQLFITPASPTNPGGFQYRFTDKLMTNFHLPESTLLAMVAALPGVGLAQLKQWYATAVNENYRFFSYGDAMLII